MRVVHEELQLLLETAPSNAASIAAPGAATWQPRPPADALPVQPQWHRTKGTRPRQSRCAAKDSAAVCWSARWGCACCGRLHLLRPAGSRRFASASSEPPAAPMAAPAVAQPIADFERLAALKRKAEERRGRCLCACSDSSNGTLPPGVGRRTRGSATTWLRRRGNDPTRIESALAHFDTMARGLDEPRAATARGDSHQAGRRAGRVRCGSRRRGAGKVTRRCCRWRPTMPSPAAASHARACSMKCCAKTAAGARAEQQAMSVPQSRRTACAETLSSDDRKRPQVSPGSAHARPATPTPRRWRRPWPRGASRLRHGAGAFEQAGRIRPGTPEVADGLQQIRRATETKFTNRPSSSAPSRRSARSNGRRRCAVREALKPSQRCGPGREGVERAESGAP